MPLAAAPADTGQTVYSVGGSGGDDNLLWRLTTGTVRGRSRRQVRTDTGRLDAVVLETQSPTNPGDSGGPVVNDRCELVGLVSHGSRNQRLVRGNIDLTEVRAFVGRYVRPGDPELLARPAPAARPPAPPPPPTPPGVDALLADLGSTDQGKQATAARKLGELGPAGRKAVPALLVAAGSQSEPVRTTALTALTAVGPPLPIDEPKLVAALAGPGPVRRYAARMYAEKVTVPRDAVAPLAGLLGDDDAELREKAAAARRFAAQMP